MILHLLTSRIVAGYVLEQFESTHGGKNVYYFIASSGKQQVDLPPESDINFILWNSKEYEALIRNFSQFDALLLHSLHPSLYPFVLGAPAKMPVAWILFGNEIYNTFRRFKTSVLLPETRRYLWRTREYYIDLAKPWYRKLIHRKTNEVYIRDCLRRINFFAATMEKTYEFLRNEGLTDAAFVQYSYYSIEQSIGKDLLDKTVTGDNILLGNSASLSSNYLDALAFLKKCGVNDRKIYTTLSYGDKQLAAKVVSRGKHFFGEQFIPLLDFLPRDEYNKILLNCAFMVMNHLRPQARGNIVTALWMGAKVFMNSENVLYQDFIEKGFLIFSITEIADNPGEAFIRLTENQVEHNRKLLSELYSHDRVLEMAGNLVQALDPTS